MGCTSSKPAHCESSLTTRSFVVPTTSSSTSLVIAQEGQQKQQAQQQHQPSPPQHPTSIAPLSGSSPFLALPRELRQKILSLTLDIRAEIHASATHRTVHTFVPSPAIPGCGGRMLRQDVVKGVFNPIPVRTWANEMRRVCGVLREEMGWVEGVWMRSGREEEFEVHSLAY